MADARDLDHAAELIGQADALIVAAGAGMGVDSGLPDFRGRQGFWRAYPALGEARIDFPAIASPAAFRAQPRLAWGFYGHRLTLYRRTRPHAGFSRLLAWGQRMPAGFGVFTSNVDGQFQAAGFPADAVQECHGSIHHLQCLQPCCDAIWPADGYTPDVDEAACLMRGDLPRCPVCGGLARPNILMFGDAAWLDSRERAQAVRLHAVLDRAKRPVVIEVGAGTAIPTVRHFSHQVLQAGGRRVRINPDSTGVPTRHDVTLAGGARDMLDALAARLDAAGMAG